MKSERNKVLILKKNQHFVSFIFCDKIKLICNYLNTNGFVLEMFILHPSEMERNG